MTQNEWNAYISGTVSANTATDVADSLNNDLLQSKIARVTQKTNEKANKLKITNEYTSDILTGMQDADTMTTQNLGRSGREIDPYGNRYDAVELRHGDNDYNMYGSSADYGKSDYAMQRQREQVAQVLNKPIDTITKQDMLDVGNQQQIQKLADLARVEGEERWIAPLIQNVEQTDLTGNWEGGLNVPIMSKQSGDIGGRAGISLGNMAGDAVSAQAALDPSQNAFARNANQSELENFYEKQANRKERSSLGNALSGFGYTLAEGVISTIDLVPEVVEYAYKNITGDGQDWSETEGLYTKENAETFKEWTGYNEKVMSQLGEESITAIKAAYHDGNYLGLAKAVWEGVTTPELAATSLGYVVGLVLPGTAAKKVVDLASGVNKAAKAIMAADKTGKLTKAQAIQVAGEQAGPGYKIANILAGNVGYVGGAEMFARDAEELYKTTYNEEMPTNQKILARAGGLLFTKMDAGIAKAIVLGKDPIAKMVPNIVKGLPDAMKVNLLGKIAVASGATAARVTGAFGLEALTEGVQTSMEKVAGLYKDDEKGVADVLGEQKFDIAGGALLGGAGGVQMTAPTTAKQVIDTVKPLQTLKKGIERATETNTQKTVRENYEYSEPLKEEASAKMASNETDSVVELVESIHGRVSKDLDESAPKSYTYGTVLKNALNKANESGDTEAIKNIYKTIEELDSREDVDFSAKEVIKDSTYKATKAFLKLINSSDETSADKMDAINLSNQVADEVGERVKETDNILNEIIAIKASIEKEQEYIRGIKGSDSYEDEIKASKELVKTIEDYIANKDLDAVNAEMSKLGFIEKDSNGSLKADPNRPGLMSYEKELTDNLLNPKVNENLLDKKSSFIGGVTLIGLQKFASSRLQKLIKGKEEEGSYQVSKLINTLTEENKEMINVIESLKETNEGLKSISPEAKESYAKAFENALDNAKTANTILAERKAILDSIGSHKGSGEYAFQVDAKGNETIQVVNGKVKTEVAKVVDGKIKWNNETTEDVVEEKVETTEKTSTPDEVVNKEDYYNKAKVPKIDELVIEDSKTDINVEVEEKVDTTKETNKTATLSDVREKIANLDTELSKEIEQVNDMDIKVHVKTYYKKKLDIINGEKSKLGKLIDAIEKDIDKKIEGQSYKNSALARLLAQANKLIKSMITMLGDLRKRLRLSNDQHREIENDMNWLIKSIEKIENDYLTKNNIKPEVVKTSIGKVSKYEDSLHGPIVESNDNRKVVNKSKSGKLDMYSAMEELKADKIAELDTEIAETNSLSSRLLKRNLEKFGLGTIMHRMLKQGRDNIFGKMNNDMFAKSDELIGNLPQGFKDVFLTDSEDKDLLIEHFGTMDKYINSIKVNDINMNGVKLDKKGVIDGNGLIMNNIVKYVPIENGQKLAAGDVIKKGNEYSVTITQAKDNIPSDLTGYKILTGLGTTSPVDILELIGTVKNGKLEIDKQTETVLKFYSAKMLTDTQAMIGNILSMDEGDMVKYLGITDPEEQMQVKQDAAKGIVNSASIRKDIGSSVYQALGLKFNDTTPEFTEESFEAALGVLVQAIAVDSSFMVMTKSSKGNKNQNMVQVNKANIESNKVLGKEGYEKLIKAMNKLQYLNESRNRPLPRFKKPEPVANGKRLVMNTRIAIDDETNAKMNKSEEIGYKISGRLAKYLEMEESEVLKAMGYKDIEASGLHISEQSAQQARNDKLVREWDILKVFAKSAKDKMFYIPWGQTISGRYTMLSDIQYQESKLHREFVVAENSTETVDINDADSRQMLEASILQGLDMDPDKLSAETASVNFNEAFKVTAKGIEIAQESPIKQAYEAMRKGELNAEAMAEVFDNSEGHHGISSIELLVDWDKAIKSGSKLETHANLEIDAITSGMILTLLQIGTDVAIEMAEKGGIYTTERIPELTDYVRKWLKDDKIEFTPGALIEAGKAHAAEIEGKMKTAKGDELVKLRTELEQDSVFKDLYSTIGVAMIGEVQAYKEKLESIPVKDRKPAQIMQLAMLEEIGELNLKNIRSIAKSPVMVYIYGASVASIKTKLTYSLGVDTVVKAIKKLSKLLRTPEVDRTDEQLKEIAEKQSFLRLFVPEKKYLDMYGVPVEGKMSASDKLLHLNISEKMIESIDKVIKATFGSAIEKAFTSRLGFVDKNRDAVKAVEMLTFEAYKIKLSDEVNKALNAKYGAGKHNGEMYKISKAELVEINAKLTEEGFGHTIVWKDGDRVRNQSLQKTGNKGGKHSMTASVGDTSVTGQVKEFKPASNTGAASTIPIHAIDGDMILEVLNRELKGELKGRAHGGNVYDAVVLGLHKGMLTDTADFYNKNMIETGFKRSIMADQLEKLETMIGGLVKEGLIEQYKAAIGLRPEGEGREDYAKEMKRLKLTLNKSIERIENVIELNEERITNSAKGFGSGHLYQMGSGVVDVKTANSRAKAMPAITRLKGLLNQVVEADRVVTAKEFGGRLQPGVDYVLDLSELETKKNKVKSAANLLQFDKAGNADGALINTLTSRDTIQVIGDIGTAEGYWVNKVKEVTESTGAKLLVDMNSKLSIKPDTKLKGIKGLKTEDKVYHILSIYKERPAPKIGGGMIDNTIIEEYERDEDKPNAEIIKGRQVNTLKDMLPYVDGRTINAWSKAADKWYKEQNRKPAVKRHMDNMLKVIAQIENEAMLTEELNWGNPKQEIGKMSVQELVEKAQECAKG